VLTLGVPTGSTVAPYASYIPGVETLVYPAVMTDTYWNGTGDDPKAYKPGIAIKWGYLPATASAPRNTRFQFTLRPNMHFPDGTPITARGEKASIEFALAQIGGSYNQLGVLKSIQTIGKYTVRINLKAPNPSIMLAFGDSDIFTPLEAACIAKKALFNSRNCGSGPYLYEMSKTIVGDHYTLIPNPRYYDQSAIHWREIYAKVIATPSTTLQALEAGQIDAAPGDPSTAKAAAAAGLKVLRVAGLGIGEEYVVMDATGNSLKALADVRVRQALNYAINRKQIAHALGGLYPTSEFETSDGVNPKYRDYYPYDPAKAKALLAAAGYSNGLTIPSFEVTAGLGDPYSVDVAQAIAQNLQAVGVTVNIKIQPNFTALYNDLTSSSPPQMFIFQGTGPMFAVFGTYSPGSQGFLALGSNGQPVWGFSNPALTRAFASGAAAKNAVKYWQKITDIWTQEAYFIPVMRDPAYYYYRPSAVKNVHNGAWGPSTQIMAP
jgi:peptide/nickel transport system substrate-binding protein